MRHVARTSGVERVQTSRQMTWPRRSTLQPRTEHSEIEQMMEIAGSDNQITWKPDPKKLHSNNGSYITSMKYLKKQIMATESAQRQASKSAIIQGEWIKLSI